jgi:anti-anti-sigma regulatory factor
VLVLDMSRVPDIEFSAMQMLFERDRRARDRGATVWLAGLNPDAFEMARRAGLDRRLGRERMLLNSRMAIERFKAMAHPPHQTG